MSAQAAAYDIPVVPHASGPYSYHYVVSQSNCPFQEYLANSPDGKSVMPVFGNLFLDEPIPINGKMQVSVLDKPGFGLTLNPKAPLIDAAGILNPSPDRLLNLNETRVLSPVSAPQAPQTVEPQAETVVESQTETVGSKPAVVGSHPQLLIGKNVAITGGATGIGRAIALKMALHGANISINFLGTAKDEISQVESLAREIEAIRPSSFLAVPGDISQSSTSKDLVAKTVDKFGRIDVLVANAGIFQPAEFLTTTEETYQKHMRINMDGVFYAIQAAANQMKRQGGGGSIIGLSSISAIVGGSNQAHYAPTKAGILSLMQTTASALGKYGIRCNALLPGTVQTQMTAGILAKEGVRKSTEAKIPLGRLGVPEDVSGPAVFLASDLSSYVVSGTSFRMMS